MGSLEGLAMNRAPLFDGSNYAFWSVQMHTYIISLDFDVWKRVVSSYTIPPTDVDGKKDFENNAKAMNTILCDLSEREFVKDMYCDSVHEI